MKCKDHPRYKGNSKPRRDCKTCWKMYEAKYPNKENYDKWIHKCKKHPRYQGKNQPKRDCKKCWKFYNYMNDNAISLERHKKLKKRKTKKKTKRNWKKIYRKERKIIENEFIKNNEYYNDFYRDYDGNKEPYEQLLYTVIANYFFYQNITKEKVIEFVDYVYDKNQSSIGSAWLKLLEKNINKEKYKIAKEEFKNEPKSFSSFILDDYKEYIKNKYFEDNQLAFDFKNCKIDV